MRSARSRGRGSCGRRSGSEMPHAGCSSSSARRGGRLPISPSDRAPRRRRRAGARRSERRRRNPTRRGYRRKLARDAELELKQRLGDDLRLIATELEKLALYAGDRAQITRADVEAIIAPVREEEFFAVGEAVAEGDLARALQLFYDEL